MLFRSNEPHVTIEVQPQKSQETLSPVDYFLSHYSSEPFKQRMLNHPDFAGMIDTGDIRNDRFNEFVKNTPEYKSYVESKKVNDKIIQIKGKGNAKPKSDYIPYVQDFVKSGNWSDIGDFHNTDLIRQDGKLMNRNEYADWMLGQLKPDQKADGGEVDAEEVFMGPKKVTHAHHLEIEERKL